MNEIEIPFIKQIYSSMNSNNEMNNYLKTIEIKHNSIINERRNKLIELAKVSEFNSQNALIEIKNTGFIKYNNKLNSYTIYDINDYYLIGKYNKYKPLIELDLSSIVDENEKNNPVFSITDYFPFIINKLNSRYKYQHSRDFDDILKNPLVIMNITNQIEAEYFKQKTVLKTCDILIFYDEYIKEENDKLYKRVKRTEEDIKYNPSNDEEYNKEYYHDMNKYYLLKYVHETQKLFLFNVNINMIKPECFFAFRDNESPITSSNLSYNVEFNQKIINENVKNAIKV